MKLKPKHQILFVMVAAVALIVNSSGNEIFADIIPPKKQLDLGISQEDIVCESGLFKIIRASTNTISCVKALSYEKLITSGWGNKFVGSEKLVTPEITELPPIGTIKKLTTVAIPTDFGIAISKFSASGYDFVFEICANSPKIYAPDVIIRSDSETKRIEFVEDVEPNSCTINTINIKAANPDSISATLQNKGDISAKITQMEENVKSLKQQLEAARKLVGVNTKDVEIQTNKISDLRKQVNEAREDLQRLYFLIYSNPSSKTSSLQKLSFTGQPIEGEVVRAISITESLSTEGRYDVVFETCAGKSIIRLPIVILSSDSQNIEIKLGEKISPNTCQMTSAKITAQDKESIMIKAAGNSEISKKVVELEKKISELNTGLLAEKKLLKDLINTKNKPTDFAKKLNNHTTKINEFREQIISMKAEVSKLLFLTYMQ